MSDDTKLILAILDRRFDKIDERFDRVDERFDRLEGRMEKLEGRVEKLEGRMENIEGRMENIEGRMENIEGRMDGVEGGLRHLQLVVENEIRPQIQILAEGHMMLNEKLDRVLENAKETEELKTRVDALETGFRLMQDKIDKSA